MKKTEIYSMILALGLSIFMISGCGGASKTSSQESDSHEHVHTLSGYQHDETDHWQVCSECGEIVGKEHHTGGTSTCTHKAICSVCGAEYGELDEHNFGPIKYNAGEDYHYQECSLCGEIKRENHVFDRQVVSNDCLVGEYQSACGSTNKYYLSCKCGEHAHSEDLTFEVTSEHSFTVEEILDGDANLISPASCTEAAVYGKVCEHCHEMFSTEATFTYGEPLGHHYGELHEEELTFYSCHTDYYHCDRCDKYFIDVREPGASDPVYQETSVDDIFDDSRCQYLDTEAGYGTEEKPYVLSTPEDLKMFAFAVNGDQTYFEHAHEGGDTFEGKFVVLGNDIVLDSEHDFGVSIGNKNDTPFSGTFDGKNYTISNYLHHGNDAVGLFSRVTNGTIKNLKLANVDVETKTQRSAGVVARASGATIQNVEIVSGTITGARENGGIVGTALSGVTITNCINRANITGSAGGNGGILGYVYNNNATITNCKNYGNISGGVVDLTPGATNRTYVAFLGGIAGRIDSTGTLSLSGCENHGPVTMTASAGIGVGGIFGVNKDSSTINISNCVNNGVITGKEATAGIMGQLRGAGQLTIEESNNNGAISGTTTTGGILGASIANGSALIMVENCDNHGAISGTTYVGGIAGLARKAKAESSLIDCNNYGDVSSTGVGCGGIVAYARINITNCGCYYDATISFKGNPVKASTLNANGGNKDTGTGWITSVIQADSSNSNGAVMSGERLINLDGSDYSA